jgi:hypothetical protein
LAHPSNSDQAITPTVKRLWLAGGGLALFIATMAAGNLFVSPDKQLTTRSAGHDFLAFYTAGTFLREGRPTDIYDLQAVQSFQRDMKQRHHLELDGFGPFWNPPVFAWLFVPLAGMSYPEAWWIWFAVNLSCISLAMVLLCMIIKGPITGGSPMPLSVWGLIVLLTAISLPFVQSLGHGQNTGVSLLLLSSVVFLWRRGWAVPAGLVCGLLFCKPQLAALLAAMLVLNLGWRALSGIAITGLGLLVTTVATLPGMLGEYLRRLPGIIRFMQVEHRYMWERHVTLKAFWRLMVQGYSVGDLTWLTRSLWVGSAILVAGGLVVVVIRTWRVREQSRDGLIAATIASAPLLMPFYFDYDLLLLSVAAVLSAGVVLRQSGRLRIDRWLMAGWVGLFAWLFVNPFVAGRTHVNGTVVLLTGLAGMLIVKAASKGAAEAIPMPQPHSARAAA